MIIGQQKIHRSIEQPVVVAVEGLDYLYLLLSQLGQHQEFNDVQLFDFQGLVLNNWLNQFKDLSNFSSVRAIGIIRDAEESSTNQEKSIKNALANNGFPVPTAAFTIHRPVNLAVGYLIIPHGQQTGCLEHACLAAADASLPLPCVEEYLKCVDNPERNENWRAKVKVHALIAAGSNPAQTLSQSAKSNLWDFSKPSLSIILEFIRKLRNSHIA